MATIDDITKRAAEIRDNYKPNSNTAELVGGVMVDLAGNLEVFEAGTKANLQRQIDTFEETVTDQVNNYKPIEITGDVTNAADEEDITSEDNLLKLKDRSSLNGMGYKILRRGKTFASQVTLSNTIYEIRYDFDLEGSEVTLPENCVLKFEGGMVKNGTLVGQNTEISNTNSIIFGSGIVFNGSWKYNTIHTNNFEGSDDYIVTSIISLCNDEVCNNIIIDDNITISQGLLNLKSNTVLNINGKIISLAANSLTNYSIISIVEKSNITIENGSIIGDVETHTGTTGEWGHGIIIEGGNNINIKNVNVDKCWGDGIYIGNKYNASDLSENINIVIENSTIEYNRRNNVSVITCKNSVIRNCSINYAGGINGTNPQKGIDIEPNYANEYVDITIDNCKFKGNVKGALDVIHIKTGIGNNITLLNCDFSDLNQMTNIRCDNLHATNCKFAFVYMSTAQTESDYPNNISFTNCSFNSFQHAYSTGETGVSFENCQFEASSTFSGWSIIHISQAYGSSAKSEVFGNWSFNNCTVIMPVSVGTHELKLYEIGNAWYSAIYDEFTQINVAINNCQLITPSYSVLIKDKRTFEYNIPYSLDNKENVCLYYRSSLYGEATVTNIYSDNSETINLYYNGETQSRIVGQKQYDNNVSISEINNSLKLSSMWYLMLFNSTEDTKEGFIKCIYKSHNGKVKMPFGFSNTNTPSSGDLIKIKSGNIVDASNPSSSDISLYAGFYYFNTTLGKPIYWNGTAWVDATGTAV